MVCRNVLVLTKEEELGARCAEVLRLRGCTCHQMTINADFSTASLIETLTRWWQDVVLCEFRMSPYSAFGVLRDLRAASLSSRIAVAALAYDEERRNEFLWQGGAAYAVLQPGSSDLRDVLDDAWRQLSSYQGSKGRRRNEILDYLRTVTDEAVFRQFIIKFFNELNYREAREAHGTSEAGKDLVFYEQNHLGEKEFVGVQAKIGDIHAKVSRSRNVTALWLQTVEALNSRVRFGGESHFLDKYVVLTSGEFNESARTKMEDFLSPTKYDKRIYLWGREKIADVIVEHAPSLDYFPK